jgi:hypothetical protein
MTTLIPVKEPMRPAWVTELSLVHDQLFSGNECRGDTRLADKMQGSRIFSIADVCTSFISTRRSKYL